MDKSSIRDAFRSGPEDDFEYETDAVALGAVLEYEGQVKIEHFVVKRDARRQGFATTVIECLEDVMREEGHSALTIEIQAADSNTIDELENYRDENENDDPTAISLRRLGFNKVEPKMTHQWGLCFTGQRILR